MISFLFNEVFAALISFYPVYTLRDFVRVLCVYSLHTSVQTSIVMNLAICIHCKPEVLLTQNSAQLVNDPELFTW